MTHEDGAPVTLSDLEPDEPYFILRGNDKLSHLVMRDWIRHAIDNGVDPKKINAAVNVADAMRSWGFSHPQGLRSNKLDNITWRIRQLQATSGDEEKWHTPAANLLIEALRVVQAESNIQVEQVEELIYAFVENPKRRA